MALLLNLYLGHLLGDFVFQPGWLVAAKRRGIPGLLTHVGIIGACTAVILFEDLASIWNVALLAVAAHAAIELVTIRARTSTPLSGLSVFLVDQVLHISSLVLLVLVAMREIPPESVSTLGADLNASAVAFACAFIVVTFMGSIIVLEVANSVGPPSWNMEILPFDRARILGMIERAAALALGVMVDPALMFVPFMPRIVTALRKSADERSRQMVIATTGFAVCIVGWALVVSVAYLTDRGF